MIHVSRRSHVFAATNRNPPLTCQNPWVFCKSSLLAIHGTATVGRPWPETIDISNAADSSSLNAAGTYARSVFCASLQYFDNDIVEQGFEVSVDQRKGLVEVNGQKIKAPIFWTKTAPKTFSFKCYPQKATGVINIWNVWRNIEYKDNIDAWIGHAGLYIEQDEDGAIIFHCSNGMHQVDFEDLVFRVKVKYCFSK